MPKTYAKELQAEFPRETVDPREKKQRLEENLRMVDARDKLLTEHAARKDIEEHQKRSTVPKLVKG